MQWLSYVDDPVIFSRTWDEHLHVHVHGVLQRLREVGHTAKPAKCQIGMSQCVYLGHVDGNREVWTELSKVEATGIHNLRQES